MADIVDTRAIKFSNEQVRPLCEDARALKARITAMSNDWFAGINVLFPNDTSNLIDNRTLEGVNELTGADVNSAVGDLINAGTALNDQIVAKPCVRVLAST